jgi:hypothetical protein
VSINRFRRVIVAPTVTVAGLSRSSREVPATVIVYVPGGRRMRYRPEYDVTTERAARPARTNRSRTCAAGALHGFPALQAGVVGPR